MYGRIIFSSDGGKSQSSYNSQLIAMHDRIKFFVDKVLVIVLLENQLENAVMGTNCYL